VVQNIVKPIDLKPPNWIFKFFENQGNFQNGKFFLKEKKGTEAIFRMRNFFRKRRRTKVILKTCPKN
jgi:hypothetical protein